jgi:hypothetical protein
VLAVERERRACADGVYNGRERPQLRVKRASITPNLVAKGIGAPDLVVLDPAREGAGKAVMAALHGHAAIRNFMEAQPTNRVLRHVNGGILIEPLDEQRARAWSQTTVYEDRGTIVVPARVGAPDMVVEYRDRLVRQGDRWLIARRDTTVVFAARGLPPRPPSSAGD